MDKEGGIGEDGAQEEEDRCSICLSAYLDENKAVTECGHCFCRGCILDVLRSSPRLGFAKCPYCRRVVSVFDIECGGSTLCERPYTIFGGVYVQGDTEGLASYHFGEEGSYICYSAAPPYWRLDDDTPPPERKPFENSSYDPDTRTFRGIVNWSPIAFHGDSRWVYRIVFSEDFMAIEGGEVTAYQAQQEEPIRVHFYRQHLFYVRLFHFE